MPLPKSTTPPPPAAKRRAKQEPAAVAVSKPRSPRASGRVTLSDLAHALGVSAMTVSRALRGEPRVQSELAVKIKAMAEQMGYVPDPAARALASQKSNQILVLVPLLSNALFVDVLEAIHQELFTAGYYPVIGITHSDSQQEELLLRSYLPMRPAGLLLTGFDHTPTVRRMLEQSTVPCVHMMELARKGEQISVGFSQEAAGAAMTEHLLERGYRRIAFCAGQLDARVTQRANGWKRVLKKHKLFTKDLEYRWPQPTSLALGAEMLNQVIAQDPSVDAIFFCNDDIAQGALLEANRRGLKVPEDMAIVGFNDLSGSDQMVPPLTTIRTPRHDIGKQSASLLLRLLRNETVAQQQVDVGYELMVRQSS